MRQRPQRDKIYTGCGNRGQALGAGTNIARGLDQHTRSVAAHNFYRVTHHLDIHVVKQDDICTGCKRFQYLSPRLALDLDLEQVGSHAAGGRDCRCNASCGLDVIVLNENAIAQAEAVIVTATGAYGVFFQDAQPGCRLTRIQGARSRALDGAYTARRDGSDAGETTKKIQGDAFGTEQRASRTAQASHNLIWLYGSSILRQ